MELFFFCVCIALRDPVFLETTLFISLSGPVVHVLLLVVLIQLE